MSSVRRPVEEIHEQSEELGRWFQSFDPSDGNEMPKAEYLLLRAARARAQCERELTKAVSDARADGATWRHIGEILGLREREARATYGLGESNSGGRSIDF